jgi:hypothetical protein
MNSDRVEVTGITGRLESPRQVDHALRAGEHSLQASDRVRVRQVELMPTRRAVDPDRWRPAPRHPLQRVIASGGSQPFE